MGQVLTQPIQSQLLQRRGNEQFKCGAAEMHGFRMSMEDCHTIAPSLSEKHPKVGLFAVFDGHAGERAAIFLEAELHKRIAALTDPTEEKALSECVQKLDADFLSDEHAREDGSTCTFCVVHPLEEGKCWEVIAVNVGDSRSIIVRKDGSWEGLTEDHKPETEAEDARIRAAGGSVQMNRVDGQLAMSRAIGDWQYKSNPNLAMTLQKVIAVPDIQKGKLYAGDHLLICCDGIVEQMNSQEAAEFAYSVLRKQRESGTTGPQDLARACWELNKYSLKRGSKDNHSCMIVSPESGTSYVAKDEFVAGPFNPYKKDQTFREAYLKDAKKHGYEGDELMELARQTEASMPELANYSDDDEGPGQGSGAPVMGLQALQALISQPGDAGDKWQMISNMLSQRGGPEEEDPDKA